MPIDREENVKEAMLDDGKRSAEGVCDSSGADDTKPTTEHERQG